MIESFPLHWPSGFPRSHPRRRAPYKATAGKARDQVIRELRLMDIGDWNVIISTNLPISARTTQFLVSRSEPADPGVAVYFRLKEKQHVFACDKWDRIADNLRAVAMTVEAMRGMDRWGCSDMLNRVFTGFAALPAPETAKSWHEVLGVDPRDTIDVIDTMYRAKAKRAHPDLGGSSIEMALLNKAIEEARRAKGAS